MTQAPTLDFSRMSTPSGQGDTLILPEPNVMAESVFGNRDLLSRCDRPLCGATLAQWREHVRRELIGDSSVPIVVTGHQPALIHAGVWAKHVVAHRLAEAVGGVAVNLVVDNDTPKSTALCIPVVDGQSVEVESVPFGSLPAGHAFEQLPSIDDQALDDFFRRVEAVLGGRFAESQMVEFFSGIRMATHARDWVDQVVAGRRAVEGRLGVVLEDRRVSDVWCGPLLFDLITHAAEFVSAYNAALADYRIAESLSGSQRPIPDLYVDEGGWVELPVWAYRSGERRRRLFAKREGEDVVLVSEGQDVGRVPFAGLETGDCQASGLFGSTLGEWRIRPRALTLTLWARLLFADLFVHGIGGAKYDRITDRIIERYFDLPAPRMACVSATLRLNLPRFDVDEDALRVARHRVRDWFWNPQRHVEEGDAAMALIERRKQAVRSGEEFKSTGADRRERERVYREIHACNRLLRDLEPAREAFLRQKVNHVLDMLASNIVSEGREYFFCLHSDEELRMLADRLPPVAAFLN